MNFPNRYSRVPLLQAIRKAFFMSRIAQQTGVPLAELTAQNASGIHRRRFVGDVFKAGVALSAASLLDGCRKAADLIPEKPIASLSGIKGNDQRIVILGAGMAGLNCAYQLKKSGYSAQVYEASARSGGRMFSKQNVLGTEQITELGGEFIDTEHKDMLKLCHEFGLPLLDTLQKDEAELLRDTFFIGGRFYTEAEVIAAFAPYQKRIAADIRSLPAVMTFEEHNEQTLRFDNMSINAYLDSIGMQGFLRTGIEIDYLTEYGLEKEEQSAINFLYLFRANTAQGFQILGTSDER